ncbi:hypothetical protein AB0K53_00930 [Streptomyces tuirus]|uniref:hypothetical protein n=1 Tax=Streptomyces tuirus TaxID=68278 RepID=UPI00342E7A77
MDPHSPEARRLLNSWNAARHGWARFQDGSRRATERLARKPLDPGDPPTSTYRNEERP